jgi:hypothetical protein
MGATTPSLRLLVPGITRGAYGSDASGASGNAETWRTWRPAAQHFGQRTCASKRTTSSLDGLDNNESLVNSTVLITPVEDMEEFRVTNSVAPAEFGRAGGAILQDSIKSGTTHYHGSAFFFDRDGIFDANPNYFSPTTPASPVITARSSAVTARRSHSVPAQQAVHLWRLSGPALKTPDGEATNTVPPL